MTLIGDYRTARRVWKDYFPAVDAIVFIIDANDNVRFEESRVELAGLMADEQVSDAPVLILGNKIDKGTAPKKDLQRRLVELFMCSVRKREGYGEGFRWLAQYLD